MNIKNNILIKLVILIVIY